MVETFQGCRLVAQKFPAHLMSPTNQSLILNFGPQTKHTWQTPQSQPYFQTHPYPQTIWGVSSAKASPCGSVHVLSWTLKLFCNVQWLPNPIDPRKVLSLPIQWRYAWRLTQLSARSRNLPQSDYNDRQPAPILVISPAVPNTTSQNLYSGLPPGAPMPPHLTKNPSESLVYFLFQPLFIMRNLKKTCIYYTGFLALLIEAFTFSQLWR